MKEIQVNKKAYYDYSVIKSFEAGIMLQSYEIKQIAQNKCNINGSFARVVNGEVFLFGMNIQRYENAVFYEPIDEKRDRKLLLHKKQINYLYTEIKTNQNLTIVPLKLYINDNGLCKLELALVKGKKEFDKRDAIKERDLKRYNND